MTDTRIARLVEQVADGMKELAIIMARPESVNFASTHAAFEKLEESLSHKAAIDTAFAWLAARNDAGRIVGSLYPVEYLTTRLGLSQAEASSRIRQGKALFDPPEKPAPVPPPQNESAAARAAREAEEERRLAAEKRAQDQARAAHASAEKRRVIEQELRALSEHAQPGPHQLRADAMAQADQRSVEDLRAWVRQAVKRANTAARQPNGTKDPLAAWKKRFLSFGRQDSDGGVRVSGYLPAAYAAAFHAALSAKQINTEDNQDATFQQRRLDHLFSIITAHSAEKEPTRRGIGSVIISMTTSELDNLRVDDEFPTNTPVNLSPLDVLLLGKASFDYLTIHDDRGHLLNIGRGQRTATLEQRLALFVTELTCSHPGCDRRVDECQVHHLIAWMHSGATDLDNLTLLCGRHHASNNDERNGTGGLGHAERDPLTGRAGYKPPGAHAVILNESTVANQSAAAKIRRRAATSAPPPHLPGGQLRLPCHPGSRTAVATSP